MIITEKCNLNCTHCMRGLCSNKSMSEEIISKTLEQILTISNLAISGGEPLLELGKLEYIFNYIIKNKIMIDEYGLVTNGTIYSSEFLKLFDYFEEYVSMISRNENKTNGYFYISVDQYHMFELERLGKLKEFFENIRKYQESKYFAGIKTINNKIFREGNALNISKSSSVKYRPMKKIITYALNDNTFDRDNGLCNIGPLVIVNTDGIVTEDVSYANQMGKYNYGSIFDDSIENICLKNKSKVLKPSKWNSAIAREMDRFYNYKY